LTPSWRPLPAERQKIRLSGTRRALSTPRKTEKPSLECPDAACCPPKDGKSASRAPGGRSAHPERRKNRLSNARMPHAAPRETENPPLGHPAGAQHTPKGGKTVSRMPGCRLLPAERRKIRLSGTRRALFTPRKAKTVSRMPGCRPRPPERRKIRLSGTRRALSTPRKAENPPPGSGLAIRVNPQATSIPDRHRIGQHPHPGSIRTPVTSRQNPRSPL